MSTGLAWLHVTVPPSLTTIASFAPGTVPLRWTANRSADGAPHPARASRAAAPVTARHRDTPGKLARGLLATVKAVTRLVAAHALYPSATSTMPPVTTA